MSELPTITTALEVYLAVCDGTTVVEAGPVDALAAYLKLGETGTADVVVYDPPKRPPLSPFDRR